MTYFAGARRSACRKISNVSVNCLFYHRAVAKYRCCTEQFRASGMKSLRWCQPNCWEVDGDFVDPGNPVVLILIKHRQVRILLPMKTFPSFLARTGCLKRIAQQSGFISDAERFVILFGVASVAGCSVFRRSNAESGLPSSHSLAWKSDVH